MPKELSILKIYPNYMACGKCCLFTLAIDDIDLIEDILPIAGVC